MEREEVPREEPIAVKIVRQIAAYDDVPPEQLTPPLYAVIDPEALNVLFRPTRAGPRDRDATVEFTYRDYTVTVHGDGTIDVTPLHPKQSPLHQ